MKTFLRLLRFELEMLWTLRGSSPLRLAPAALEMADLTLMAGDVDPANGALGDGGDAIRMTGFRQESRLSIELYRIEW